MTPRARPAHYALVRRTKSAQDVVNRRARPIHAGPAMHEHRLGQRSRRSGRRPRVGPNSSAGSGDPEPAGARRRSPQPGSARVTLLAATGSGQVGPPPTGIGSSPPRVGVPGPATDPQRRPTVRSHLRPGGCCVRASPVGPMKSSAVASHRKVWARPSTSAADASAAADETEPPPLRDAREMADGLTTES